MTFTPHGKHLIDGAWVDGSASFTSAEGFTIGSATAADVDRAAKAAEASFAAYSATTRGQRADFLRAIADEIESRGETITEVGTRESSLPEGRLNGERGRTTGQLRMFADHIEAGDYLDRRFDSALPDRQPAPRPDMRMIQRPIGPVAVFGASNFPLAFSTAGGDTAAALAAGCPVIVKGHPAHPGTGEIVAEAILAAQSRCNMPSGTFQILQGETHEFGGALVQHPLIKAVGFTGSLGAGRALYDLCAKRPEPIPFFGELGSINPVFVMPEALKARGEELGKGWAGSLTMGAGQFCTNPGVVLVQAGDAADAFTEAARATLSDTGPQVMLTDGIADAYRKGAEKLAGLGGVQAVLKTSCADRQATPFLFRVTAEEFLADEELSEEVFGPLGVIITCKDAQQMLDVAARFEGQLTATLQMDDADTETARPFVPVLERKAGRILVNGFPTGVEVADTMVHGGPYPASTNFGATSVGTMSIRRFLRPVCYQNLPQALLPDDLQGA
ncbi:aldehyde dehydrogenase (NADP(+)) [Rhodobacteraceae bacterium]|nr:aldehyde dehydrogenase (NADP(+)) [Paracoccaceae bacterium]